VAVALVVGVMLGAVLDWLSTVSVGIGWLAAFLIFGGIFVWLAPIETASCTWAATVFSRWSVAIAPTSRE
jgi:hypothetical protein